MIFILSDRVYAISYKWLVVTLAVSPRVSEIYGQFSVEKRTFFTPRHSAPNFSVSRLLNVILRLHNYAVKLEIQTFY